MPHYALKYFNLRGYAEVARLLFALAEQQYDDIRIEMGAWPAEKKNTPFGHVPVLEIDGKPYTQSSAIIRYLARTFNFYGQNNMEALQIDEVLGIVTEFDGNIKKVYDEKDEIKKKEVARKVKRENIPRYLSMLEQLLSANGCTGFFVGEKISLADLSVYSSMEKVGTFGAHILDDYPQLQKSVAMVSANPRIKTWVQKRPKTKY